MFLPYVIIGVNTSSLKMVSLVKCGRWESGGQKLWEVGELGSKISGGGRLAPLCHPPPPYVMTMLFIHILYRIVAPRNNCLT